MAENKQITSKFTKMKQPQDIFHTHIDEFMKQLQVKYRATY